MNIIEGTTIVKDDKKNEYILEECIGKGGFGFVYKAKNMNTNKYYAIKTIQSTFRDESDLNVFKNEIKMCNKIKSENVIKYIFIHDGTMFSDLPPYIIMELANKGTLSSVLKKQKSRKIFFENDILIEFFKQLSNGMLEINSKLVHRDIKPDNILVQDSLLKITDFGLAKISGDSTRTMSFKGYGTAKYVAPEAWDNDKNTIQMDIYSMGIIFFELATLQYPYEIENDINKLREQHLYSTPRNPKDINSKLDTSIASLIIKMLEKETSKRFNNWNEIIGYLSLDKKKQSNIDENIIDSMLSMQLDKDIKIQEEKSKKEKMKKMEEDFCKKIEYQYNCSILKNIEAFISKFNSQYTNGEIKIKSEKNGIGIENTIKLISGYHIIIEVVPLLESNFIRRETLNLRSGREHVKEEVRIPSIKGRKILAWGGLYTTEKTGFNIFLLEKKNEIYGEWFIMENTNNALSRRRERPSPFGFRLDELEKEITFIDSTHIYASEITAFKIEKFYEYIHSYNNKQ